MTMASLYLGRFVHLADLPSRRALRSASTSRLVVLTFKRSAVGGRTFEVSGSRMWNELPEDVATAPSLPIFRRRRLKTHISSSNHVGPYILHHILMI